MRVTCDSNAWERVFASDETAAAFLPIKKALSDGRIRGFICEIGFKIEAVQKRDRLAYFSQPAMRVDTPGDVVVRDGKPFIRIMSIGPDDARHPGLPLAQAVKLHAALKAGIRLLRCSAWMGLPVPRDIMDPALFAEDGRSDREQCHLDVRALIESRGVGKAIFDSLDGWKIVEGSALPGRSFQKACAEWADGEMVAAHIAYRNDILCTNDHGRGAGRSVLDAKNRDWLASEFGVRFMTLEQLNEVLAAASQ